MVYSGVRKEDLMILVIRRSSISIFQGFVNRNGEGVERQWGRTKNGHIDRP